MDNHVSNLFLKDDEEKRNSILIQILTFVDKKRAKKIINLHGLVEKIKEALRHRTVFAIYYINDYFINFLNLLKTQGYIFNYYIVPVAFFKSFLKYGYKDSFYSKLVLIYFSGSNFSEQSLKRIVIISKPSRQIYFTYMTLQRLLATKNLACSYVLNTTKGLITHSEALEQKIGGNLVCVVY